jgi:hypothetical protein
MSEEQTYELRHFDSVFCVEGISFVKSPMIAKAVHDREGVIVLPSSSLPLDNDSVSRFPLYR